MQNTKDKIYFNFSYLALKLLGDGLYSNPWTAISELIANGIDAEATKIYLYINMINKQSSTIEIFDNGHGMNYVDLAEKYTLIGKNKRLDVDLDDTKKNKVIGRKGIGKLAALYLTSTYYLISRIDSKVSSWCFDMSNTRSDEIPNLKKINRVQIEAETQWQSCKTGTIIKLVNVDLRNIGEQTIEGIKARIADYYAFNNNEEKIEIFIAFKQNSKNKVVFERAEKQIAFGNYYAFFDNTNEDFKSKLSPEILLKTNFPEKMPNTKKIKEATKEIFYKQCPVKILNNVFHTSGKQKFKLENGIMSEKTYKYELIGWIGIHSTIEKREAKLNDNIFVRNKAYQPNRLRLYVRNKLAVENFMEYLHNTQALGKYIEGEIHFDILDNNSLPDIATADREDYKEDNDRIQKLIEILKPIVGALIRARSDVGTQLRSEETKYREAKEAEEIAKREKAEQKARKAEDARQKAETKYQQAENSRKQYEKEVNVRKQQTYFLEAALTVDDRTRSYNTHIIKGNAEGIAENLKYISKKHPELKKEQEFQYITYLINKIIMTAKNFSIINYNFERTIENDDLGYFVEQYFNSMVTDDKLKIEIENTSNSYIRFPYQDFTMMLHNVVSNSKKAKSTKLRIEMYNENRNIILKFIDNGIGIENGIELNSLFDFGLSHTRNGTGIGLAQIKDLVENELNGTVTIKRNKTKGVTLEVIIPNENQL